MKNQENMTMVKTGSSQHSRHKDGTDTNIIRDFKISMISILQDLVEKLDNIHKQMSNFSRERETIKKKNNINIGNGKYYYRK